MARRLRTPSAPVATYRQLTDVLRTKVSVPTRVVILSRFTWQGETYLPSAVVANLAPAVASYALSMGLAKLAPEPTTKAPPADLPRATPLPRHRATDAG